MLRNVAQDSRLFVMTEIKEDGYVIRKSDDNIESAEGVEWI
jgi:hypothetical protein